MKTFELSSVLKSKLMEWHDGQDCPVYLVGTAKSVSAKEIENALVELESDYNNYKDVDLFDTEEIKELKEVIDELNGLLEDWCAMPDI